MRKHGSAAHRALAANVYRSGRFGLLVMNTVEHPERTAQWAAAAERGMSSVLATYVREHGAQWEWNDAEHPTYGPCVCCGEKLRVDRLDLIVEHLELCPAFMPVYLRNAS